MCTERSREEMPSLPVLPDTAEEAKCMFMEMCQVCKSWGSIPALAQMSSTFGYVLSKLYKDGEGAIKNIFQPSSGPSQMNPPSVANSGKATEMIGRNTEEGLKNDRLTGLGVRCQGCGVAEAAPGTKLSKCARCRRVHFCGPRCQKMAWSEHRQNCRAPKKKIGGGNDMVME